MDSFVWIIEYIDEFSQGGKEVLAVRELRISRETKITLNMVTADISLFGCTTQKPAVSKDLLFIPISSRKPR